MESESPTDQPPAAVAPARLEYDLKPAAISRRQVNFLLLLLAINTILFAAFICLPAASPMLRQWWDERQKRLADEEQKRANERAEAQALAAQQASFQACRDHAAPATQVVYAEAPAEVAKLLAAFGRAQTFQAAAYDPAAELGWRYPAARGLPDVLLAVPELQGAFQGENCVFLHAMKAPSGAAKLAFVSIYVEPAWKQNDQPHETRVALIITRAVHAAVIGEDIMANFASLGSQGRLGSNSLPGLTTQTWLKIAPDPTRRTEVTFGEGNKLTQRGHWRVFAGQADPKDPTHMTIAYEIDGEPGTIDGWLRDGDRLMLEPRVGNLVGWNDAREYVWDLKATTPATNPVKRGN